MSGRILIVDDEKPLVYYLQQTLLLEMPSSVVDTAYSGEEALSQLANSRYDLILADVKMPGVSGLELVKGVRYLDGSVPIVLMTGFGSEELQREARLLGVSHYLDKPFAIPEMLDLVGRLLGGEETRGA